MINKVVILSAKRTPFGIFGGSLKNLSAIDLGVISSIATINQIDILKNKIEQVIFGNVLQTSVDAIYLARHIGLKTGLTIKTPAITINRLCGSGLQAIISGAEQIMLKESRCVLVGGTESMSQAPYILRNSRWENKKFGNIQLEDYLWNSLNDTYINMSMAITAENIASLYSIKQKEIDEFSIRSNLKYKKFLESKRNEIEITSIDSRLKNKKHLLVDENFRKNITIENLKTLPKIFKKNGVLHAGACSEISDGSSSLILSSLDFAEKNNIKPIAEIVNYGICGCDPKIMGIGPIDAIEIALRKAKLKISEIDLFEINETFAPQVLAIKNTLNIPMEKININGGAITIGNPLGASGARLVSNLAYTIRSNNLEFGLATTSIGGGQGIAIILKNSF